MALPCKGQKRPRPQPSFFLDKGALQTVLNCIEDATGILSEYHGILEALFELQDRIQEEFEADLASQVALVEPGKQEILIDAEESDFQVLLSIIDKMMKFFSEYPSILEALFEIRERVQEEANDLADESECEYLASNANKSERQEKAR